MKFIWSILELFFPKIKAVLENQNHYNPKQKPRKSAKKPDPVTDGEPFGYPVKGKYKIWSRFRSLLRPSHNGVDIASSDWGCYATEAGVISEIVEPNYKTPAQFVGRGRKWVRIHPNDGSVPNPYVELTANNGTKHYFVHVMPNIEVGTKVKKGMRLGTWKGPRHPKNNGSWGNSKGQHIHWGVKVESVWVNPMKYAKERLK